MLKAPLYRVGVLFADPITEEKHLLMMDLHSYNVPTWCVQTPDELIDLSAYLIDNPNLRDEMRRLVAERFD